MSKKILIVEDEKLLREALVARLSAEDYQLFEAQNGKQGLTMALQEKPDLILLDLIMPVMDGMTMLKILRQDDWGKIAKVMILTNLSDNTKVLEAMEKEALDYLVKTDWKLDEIVQKIKTKLD